ncbi:Uncharacterised protein [Mycobacterium tuberculosis]|uniref:Uncharacterized protein n=1 Tax=Mycobacterium tuberculosis TaxID=1773 RepID=A0A654TVC6_MYCTX|nr:Uncharacterised protein [Mycobacterium tuberculosis]CKQ71183.1 Uncharacterised protein [Mycobacterium tuberculosis]CKQ89048.1 Uncharacterised protein [Mycobacterium tuberculosis]CKR16149.1 Uncharacterised protein [Mycobacterium tuberculosis]CKR26920.1 Uncharacterised protein [Mycobacterium tuberculosis]
MVLELVAKTFGERLSGIGTHWRCGYEDEFVAAESGDQALANECVTDPLGEHMDELVTGGVAQVVVDGLEAVQVEK